MDLRFFNYPAHQAAPRASRQWWRGLCAFLLIAGMIRVDAITLRAETNTPASDRSHKSAAIQLYAAGVQLAPLLPELLGFTEPQTYLLLLQNNHELRATGGFITAVGRVTVDKGRIAELVLQDSYEIARHDVDHPLAPEAVKRYMNIEILFLRDINWSPDFPTTARLASSMYAQDAGIPVDGVISVDLRAVELLVGALAPLEVTGSEVVLTGENVMQAVMDFWNRPPTSEVDEDVETASLLDRKDWVYQRKDFIPLLAEAAIARLQSGSFNPFTFVNSVTDALNERAVQVWLADPAAAELMAEFGWDGALQPETGADYLALVDMNMGYNKVNAVLERSMTHRVTWPDGPDAPAQATVTVTYHHPLDVTDPACIPWTDFDAITSYMGMIARCYFGYVRLYVPGGSELIALEGVEADSVVAQPGEAGTTVFGGYFSMQPAEEHTVAFTYTLPATITPENYRLVVQRQAGGGPLPLEVQVDDTAFEVTMVGGRLEWPPAPPAMTVTR